MAIKNGLHDADEVMNALGTVFKNQATLIWDADLKGFDSDLQEDWQNLEYETTPSTDGGDYPTTEVTILSSVFGGFNVLDNFETGTVDTNIWSVTSTGAGSVSESGGNLILTTSGSENTGTQRVVGDQANSIDLNQQMTLVVFIPYSTCSVSGGSGHASCHIKAQITDGSTVIDLFSVSAHNDAGGGNVTGVYRYEVDATGDELKIYKNDINGENGPTYTRDISSLGASDWNIQFEVYGTGSTGNRTYTAALRIGYIRYIEGTVQETEWISETKNVGETVTDAILVVATPNLGSITYYLSADGGSNWEEVTEKEIHRFTNTGTNLKVKAELTGSGIGNDAKFEILKHWAIWYNTGAQ